MTSPSTVPASAPAPAAVRRAPLAPARLAGVLLTRALDPQTVPVRRVQDGIVHVDAPGFELRCDADAVAVHVYGTAVTCALGRPTLDGHAASLDELATVLAYADVPWSRIGGRHALVRIDLAAGTVTLATDRFGVWPLAWSRTAGRIAFSDRADRVDTGEPPRLDAQALFDYAWFHMIPAPHTVFSGVHRVEPATALRLHEDGVTPQPTWRPRFAAADTRADASLPQAFRDAVKSAVLDEADGAQPGCFLSGGTDSSTVAGMLARERGRALTFSIGFDAEGYDEMAYARIAAKHFGTEHNEYYVTPEDLVRAIPQVARRYDQPFGNSSAVPAYYCARMARSHGVDRMLAGDGGDELYGGNLRYAKQKVFELYGAVPGPARALLEPLVDNPLARAVPGVSKAASYVRQARIPMPARTETYNLLARFGHAHVFTPAFLAQVDTGAPAALQADVYGRHRDAAFVDRMLAYDWRFTLADNDLPKVTGTTALAGVGVGFPLLADAVVDVSLRLGANDKVRGTQLRHFFKESLRGFLPDAILAKKKHGFGLPVGPWLVSSLAFRGLAYESLNGLVERGLVRAELVDDLFSRRLEEHPGYYGEMAWVLMMLEQWLRAHAPAWTAR